MNIFHKRPLGLILCVILGGFSIFAILNSTYKILLFVSSVLLCLYAFIYKKGINILAKVISASLLSAFIFSFLYFDVFFYPTKFYDKEVTIEAKVTDIETKSDYYKTVDIKTDIIDGKKSAHKIKLHLYGQTEEVFPGNIIRVTAKINELEDSGNFDFKQYYSSRGISANATATYIEILDDGAVPLSYKMEELRSKISKRAEDLSNAKAGGLLSALLLGERDLLSGQTNLDYTRIGIVHILSLGGMHLAILMGAMDKLLYFCRVGKNWRTVFGCIFSLLFIVLTGFSVTITRAGIMLIISSILLIISGSKDSLTSLFIAAAAIVLVTPYAALDLGFWLSVFATVGILVAGDIINDKYTENKGFSRLIKVSKISVAFSVFAISSTAILTSINFSGTSSLSLLCTLIFSILIEIYLYLGIAVLILGNLISLGKLLIFFESIISKIAAFFSDLEFAYASNEFIIVKTMFILLGILFFLFIAFDIKKKKEFILIMTAAFIVVSVLPIAFSEANNADDSFIAESFDKADFLLIKSDKNSLFLDSSSHKSSDTYNALAFIADEKISEIDYYMIASYSDYLPEGIELLLSRIRVDRIGLPMPESTEEEQIAIDTFKTVNEFRCEISFYEDKNVTYVGKYEILVPFRNSTDKTLAITFKRGDEIYSYLSSGILDTRPRAEELLYVSDAVIFGVSGKTYEEQINIDEYGNHLKKIAVFDEKINFVKREDITDVEIYTDEKTVLYD